MIEKIDLTGNNYKISESLKKYALKRLAKLDRYLPKGSKKDVVLKVVITEVNRAHNNKYDISAAMEVHGGRVLAAKDECSNVFAGIDIIEAKLMGQIRRYKLEATPHLRKNLFSKLFIKRG